MFLSRVLLPLRGTHLQPSLLFYYQANMEEVEMLQIFADIYEESSEMLQHLRAMMEDVDQLGDGHLAHQVRTAWFSAAHIFNCAGLPFAALDDGLIEEGYETADEQLTEDEQDADDEEQDADEEEQEEDEEEQEEDEAGV